MKTFPVTSEDGKLEVGFEIENAYATPSEVARVLRGIAGVSDIQKAGSWLSGNDIRLKFIFDGIAYMVLEPFGDNSRYYIGPELKMPIADQLNVIEEAFRAYKPSAARQVVGDILTLKTLINIVRFLRSRGRSP